MKWEMGWTDRAVCRHCLGEHEWVPSDKRRSQKVADAIQICSTRCPVQRECARFALETGQQGGVWGGVDLGGSEFPPAPHKIAGLQRVMNRKDTHA